MSSFDNSPSKPRSRSDFKKRFFHRGYLGPWILVLAIPFVLRFVMFNDAAFPYRSSPSTEEVLRLDELQLYKFSESSSDDVERTIVRGTRVVRPGVGVEITHGDRVDNANEGMKNDPSHGSTKNVVSNARHIPVTKVPDVRDVADVNVESFEENEEDFVQGVVDEVQLRQIGERIEAIKRLENWEDRSRWHDNQELASDKLEDGKGTEEKKGTAEEEEMKATQEELASEDRKPGDTDETAAVKERIDGAMEAYEDRNVIGEDSDRTWKAAREQKAAEKRTASKENVVNEQRNDAGKDDEKIDLDGEKRASDGSEASDERRDVRVWETEEERKLEEEKEAEEERRAAKERDTEEELMVAKEREAERETIAAQEKEADQSEIEEKREAQEEGTVAEQLESGREEKSEAEKPAEDKRVGNENSNDVEQNHDVKETDLKEKTDSVAEEKKSTSEQNEDERTVNLEEPTEEGKHTEDQKQGNDNEEKHGEKHTPSDQHYPEDLTVLSGQIRPASLAEGECDLFDGDWEYDPEGPLYTNSTCFIRGDHNCMSNGRPDTDFLNWRWKPRGCDLPRFDGRPFMEAFRGKTFGFVGDSLARNQIESFLCMLSLVEVPIYLHGNKTITRWLFKEHQVTLIVIWSPYLLKEAHEGVIGFEEGQSVLFLDVLDPVWTSILPDFDIVMFSVGQWYFKPSVYVMEGEVIGCNNCPKLNLTEMSFPEQYGRTLRRVLEKVTEDWKGIAILSTFANSHSERDDFGRAQCRRKPIDSKEWRSSFRGIQFEMREVVVGEFNGMVNDKSKLNNDVHLEFLDVSTLSLLRPDGHSGPYYSAHPYEGKKPDEWVNFDCLHWCLPGPVDTWNQVLVKIVQKYL